MRLDNSARMNLPGQAGGNWAWRVGGPEVWERLAPEADALRALAETYGRLAPQVRADGLQGSLLSEGCWSGSNVRPGYRVFTALQGLSFTGALKPQEFSEVHMLARWSLPKAA